jgi:hypothetical protein
MARNSLSAFDPTATLVLHRGTDGNLAILRRNEVVGAVEEIP